MLGCRGGGALFFVGVVATGRVTCFCGAVPLLTASMAASCASRVARAPRRSRRSAASGGSLSSLVKTMTAAHNAVQFAGIAKAAARERKQTVAAARKSARAAALLIACVNEKCKGDETCSKKEFKEAMLQLGVIGDKSDSVDELFDSSFSSL